MSFRTVVVPEDPTQNGYILKPLVRAVLTECGKPHARIDVLTNPRTQGYEHAKALLRDRLIETYKRVDLLLFLPDSDGKDRSDEFADLLSRAAEHGTRLVCCAAVPEVEIWLLAGHIDKLTISWSEARADISAKENIFDPFLERYGDKRRPGQGREDLMKTTVSNYRSLKTYCPEIEQMERDIREFLVVD